eukprot:TRINITY_DN65980_c0_g2_i5.p1 TRINITY_DN65980_c0_g2~~TRINITY_DN65980_c0_g2_i5.p1  ORF type:complete len:877 (+),score=23.85 TRINITY_DN65980_c0_g2_i5:56-2632(+)
MKAVAAAYEARSPPRVNRAADDYVRMQTMQSYSDGSQFLPQLSNRDPSPKSLSRSTYQAASDWRMSPHSPKSHPSSHIRANANEKEAGLTAASPRSNGGAEKVGHGTTYDFSSPPIPPQLAEYKEALVWKPQHGFDKPAVKSAVLAPLAASQKNTCASTGAAEGGCTQHQSNVLQYKEAVVWKGDLTDITHFSPQKPAGTCQGSAPRPNSSCSISNTSPRHVQSPRHYMPSDRSQSALDGYFPPAWVTSPTNHTRTVTTHNATVASLAPVSPTGASCTGNSSRPTSPTNYQYQRSEHMVPTSPTNCASQSHNTSVQSPTHASFTAQKPLPTTPNKYSQRSNRALDELSMLVISAGPKMERFDHLAMLYQAVSQNVSSPPYPRRPNKADPRTYSSSPEPTYSRTSNYSVTSITSIDRGIHSTTPHGRGSSTLYPPSPCHSSAGHRPTSPCHSNQVSPRHGEIESPCHGNQVSPRHGEISSPCHATQREIKEAVVYRETDSRTSCHASHDGGGSPCHGSGQPSSPCHGNQVSPRNTDIGHGTQREIERTQREIEIKEAVVYDSRSTCHGSTCDGGGSPCHGSGQQPSSPCHGNQVSPRHGEIKEAVVYRESSSTSSCHGSAHPGESRSGSSTPHHREIRSMCHPGEVKEAVVSPRHGEIESSCHGNQVSPRHGEISSPCHGNQVSPRHGEISSPCHGTHGEMVYRESESRSSCHGSSGDGGSSPCHGSGQQPSSVHGFRAHPPPPINSHLGGGVSPGPTPTNANMSTKMLPPTSSPSRPRSPTRSVSSNGEYESLDVLTYSAGGQLKNYGSLTTLANLVGQGDVMALPVAKTLKRDEPVPAPRVVSSTPRNTHSPLRFRP